MKHTTESKSLDVLTSHIDLLIYLPSGQELKMPVDPKTPMLDLLIKICTRNGLKLSEYTLQPIETDRTYEYSDRVLQFKPSTLVGLLGTDTIKVIKRVKSIPVQKTPVPVSSPFEHTFRLKIHLPRNQLYVTRVRQNVHLYDILREVCDEKKLDSSRFSFQHPGNPSETLDLNLKMGDYRLSELNLISLDQIASSRRESISSQNDRIDSSFNTVPRRERFGSTDSNSSNQPSSLSCGSCTTSSKPQSKSTSRKKRPAPRPPTAECDQFPKDDRSYTSSHSRNSSDSSGYHETSFLSDSCVTPPANNSKPDFIPVDCIESRLNNLSCKDLALHSEMSKSVPNLLVKGRVKKRAPPPPPPTKAI